MAPSFGTIYRRLEGLPLGRQVASRVLRVAAPYFLTIPATVTSLEPGHGTARMPRVPWTRNHLGTVHAISLCNLAELTMGAVAEATVPPTHRWVPRGMQVRYTAMARGTMHATATLELPAPLGDRQDVPVAISIVDDHGTEVLQGAIDIHITARTARAPS